VIGWLKTLLGMGPASDVRAEVLARPVIHRAPPPPLPRILGIEKPHLVRRYDVMTDRRVWYASNGLFACYGTTPTKAYENLMDRINGPTP
jgi:hypothetical protein